MWKKIISVLCLYILIPRVAAAQIIHEAEATPSVLSEAGSSFLITEINFKNSTADWVKMKYLSPSGKALNIRNISFADDSSFKTINNDTYIASGQELLLTFKMEQDDSVPYLYSARSGLTGTTEQFIVYDVNSTVLDAVCWSSETPTEKEAADMAGLYENEGWNSADVHSCIESEKVKTNESLLRIAGPDSGSRNDWITQTDLAEQTSPNNTPAVIPSGTAQQQDPDTVISTPGSDAESNDSTIIPLPENSNLYQDTATDPSADSVTNSTNTPDWEQTELVGLDNSRTTSLDTSKTEKSKSKKTSSSTHYANGDLSAAIVISEIMPNPDGTDTGKEWIEIFNSGNQDINMGNWTIDDSEEGSKPYVIPSSVIIAAGKTYVFENKETKISLGNGEDEVRLFDFNGEIMETMAYEEASDGMSYAKIIIREEAGPERIEQIWTTDVTKNEPNPSYLEITGQITREPEFSSYYGFEIEDSQKNRRTISFTEDIIAAPLAKASFTFGSTVKLIIKPDPDYPEIFRLVKFSIVGAKIDKGNNNLLIPSAIGLILLLGAVAFFSLRKKIPWQDIKEPLTQTK